VAEPSVAERGRWHRTARADTHDVIGEDFAGVLAAAQRGDEVAFARLWRDANPPLLRYLSVVSSGDQDDVASETWTSVVRGLSRFHGGEHHWRAWLFATARRRAVDDGRRRARVRDRSVGDGSDLDDLRAVAPAADPAEVVVAHQVVEEALAAIRRLPPLQAEVLMLRLVADLPSDVVAEMVGSTPGAVRVAAHRGLKRVAQELAGTGVTP
jgi:RNA polymerase sigma-70 factor, ECF subfamily